MSPPSVYEPAPSAPTPEAEAENLKGRNCASKHAVLHEYVNDRLGSEPHPTAGCRPGADGVVDPTLHQSDDSDFLELCRNRSGEVIDLDLFEKNKAARERLVDDSLWIADQLESKGIKAHEKSKLGLRGLCSGQLVLLPAFRNIVFIPVVAARKRGPMVNLLEYYLERNPFARMWVFTSGERTRISEVRGRIGNLHRKLSRLNNQSFMKEAGVQIVFRSTELGSILRIEAKEATVHIHAHTIVKMARKLPGEEWSALLSAIRRWWKHHFEDSERIHKAREVCKYVVKPQDLRSLTAEELVGLQGALEGLHLVQPMGEFKALQKEIEGSGEKLVRKRRGSALKLVRVKNWNPRRKKKPKKEPMAENRPPLRDYVVTTLVPAPYFGPVSEPAAIVLNPTGEDITRFGRAWRAKRAAQPAYDSATERGGL